MTSSSFAFASAASLVGLLEMPAAITDSRGAVESANAHWEALTSNRARASHLTGAFHPADQLDIIEVLDTLQTGVARPPCEVRLGTGRWAHLQASPVADGGERRWLWIVTDIHDLKAAHRTLAERSRVQRTLLDQSTDCIKLIDISGRLISMNTAGCEALGVDPASGFGQVWLDLLPPDIHAEGAEALVRVRQGETARFTGRSISSTGEVEAWDNLLTPALDERGGVAAILCVSRNVTDEQRTQAALLETQERLAMAAKVGGLGIWDFDVVTNRLQCDATWHRIMGRDPEEPITTLEEFRPLIHPDDLERVAGVTDTAYQLPTGSEYDNYSDTYRIIRPDGEVRWIRTAAGGARDLAGRPQRVIGCVVDVTEEMLRQTTLEQDYQRERLLVEQVQRIAEYKSRLVATVSHDLVSPLSAIRLHLDMIDAIGADPDRLTRALAVMRAATSEVLASVEGLVALYRAESDDLPAEAIDLVSLVRGCVSISGPLADAGGIVLVGPDPAECVWAHGVEVDLSRMVSNVVMNAIKYTPQGGRVEVEVRPQADADQGAETVVIGCRDTGIGMSPQERERLFEEFFRSDRPEVRTLGGAGLGMAIVARVAERHGGHVTVDSTQGVGTLVEIHLPRHG